MIRIAVLLSGLVVPVTSLVSGRATVPSIEDCYAVNQKTRKSIKQWITPADIRSSIFGYGMTLRPIEFAPQVSHDVGRQPIQHDFISQLGARMQAKGQRVKYLEIGVAVLKGVHTQAHYFKDAQITALDIEDPNPTIEKLWANKKVLDSWTDTHCEHGQTDARRAHNRTTDYVNAYDGPRGTGNTLFYVAGDALNSFTYKHVAKNLGTHNLILSDGLHTSEAIYHEVKNLLSFGIINSHEEFAMVWDDCGGDLWKTFHNDLVPMLRKKINRPVCHGQFRINGWIGSGEGSHHTCVFTTFDLRGPHLGTGGRWRPRKTLNGITCLGFQGRQSADDSADLKGDTDMPSFSEEKNDWIMSSFQKLFDQSQKESGVARKVQTEPADDSADLKGDTDMPSFPARKEKMTGPEKKLLDLNEELKGQA